MPAKFAEHNPTATQASDQRNNILATVFNPFGSRAIRLNNNLGAIAIFLFRAVIMIFRLKQIPEIINQIYFIGARSVQIVMLVGFFTGVVTSFIL
jgi:phospholipid/cholesterol/gamma-HCH transport system permease protein